MKCPICGQETTWQNNPTRPFCSEKCQMLDLGKWATEGYSISGNPLPELDKDASLANFDREIKADLIN
ncbi:MAG: hypothetical protein FD167_5481 [bacterium]|nr:MAG: hypothetical protein FD167_5481 [bacterium]